MKGKICIIGDSGLSSSLLLAMASVNAGMMSRHVPVVFDAEVCDLPDDCDIEMELSQEQLDRLEKMLTTEQQFGRALRVMPKEAERFVMPEKDLDRPAYQKPAFKRGKGQRNKSWQF